MSHRLSAPPRGPLTSERRATTRPNAAREPPEGEPQAPLDERRQFVVQVVLHAADIQIHVELPSISN
jgi:hypothetical protein